MLKGILSDQSPRLPPTIEGEADINNACRSLNGCGRNRETQSITFFRRPGIEAIIFRRRNNECIVCQKSFPEFICTCRNCTVCFRILVERRAIKLTHACKIHFAVIFLNYLCRLILLIVYSKNPFLMRLKTEESAFSQSDGGVLIHFIQI